MGIFLNSKHILLVFFGIKMATTIRSLGWFKFVTSTEVNHFLCSSFSVEESSDVFSCWGMLCLLLSLLLSEAGQPDVCLWGISGFTRNFHSPLESTWLATNLPWGTSKLSVCTVKIFFVVTTCHQSFSLEFNESLLDRWVNVILYILEYCMQKDILNSR